MLVGINSGGVPVVPDEAKGVAAHHLHIANLGPLLVQGKRTGGRRGFSLRAGERVAVVEDVVTTGRSTREVVQIAQGAGAQVLAVAAIVDRSGRTAAFGVPFVSLLTLDVPAFPAGQCEMCRRGLPLEKPGSRAAGGGL